MTIRERIEKEKKRFRNFEIINLYNYFYDLKVDYIEEQSVIDLCGKYDAENYYSNFIITDEEKRELVMVYFEAEANKIINKVCGKMKDYKRGMKVCLSYLNHIMPPEEIYDIKIKYLNNKMEKEKGMNYIYGIVVENEIIYIGLSNRDIGVRFMEHREGRGPMYNEMRQKGYEFVILLEFSSITPYELENVEELLIGLLKPRYNKQGSIIGYQHKAKPTTEQKGLKTYLEEIDDVKTEITTISWHLAYLQKHLNEILEE